MKELLNEKTASLKISGGEYSLIPEKMTADGNIYKLNESGATFSLELCEYGSAFTTLLRITADKNGRTPVFSDVKSLDKEFTLNGELDFETLNGDDCGAESFIPLKQKLTDKIHIEPFGGRPSDRSAFPFFEVHSDTESYIFAVGWTGQWCADIYKTEKGFRVAVGLCDSNFYLEPGEEVRLPLVLVFRGGYITEARQNFRMLILEKFSPRPGGKLPQMPIAIQPFDRYFNNCHNAKFNAFWNTQEGQLEESVRAEKCGFDAQWIDAAWMTTGFPNGIGNYSYAPGYPNGLKPVADAVHEKGMKFVIWFEPERVVIGTEMYNNHPEWMLKLEPSTNCLFDLSENAAADYLAKLLGDMIEENGIDVYRQDFNMCPLGYWRTKDTPDRQGITEMHYVENYYRVLDSLFARFPGLMMDNCSSGGRRLDLEMVKRSVTLWRSDTGCNPEHEGFENTLWNNLQTIVLGRYLPFTCCASWATDAYSVRGVFTGGIALNLDILADDFNPDEVKGIIEECRRCRRYWYGKFIEITLPDMDTEKWAAYRLDCGDEGCMCYFRKRNAENAVFSMPTGRFDDEALYSVTMTDENLKSENCEMTGKQLSELTVTIPQKRASLLVEYKKKADS